MTPEERLDLLQHHRELYYEFKMKIEKDFKDFIASLNKNDEDLIDHKKRVGRKQDLANSETLAKA